MIDFGDWINKHKENFSDDVYGLFCDSLRCFKNDIDRPSYLLAYQGMIAYIRNLIQVSPCPPTGITDIDWRTNYLSDINCDDKCDEKIKTCILQGSKGSGTKVLSMPKEAREKFDFWRQLRNVSAHYKGFDLVKAHTTALYAFIEQYLLNIHIEGSKGSLEQEFDDYFNPALTSPSEDVMPHIQKIDEMVEPSELATFFDSVRKSIHHYHPYHSRFTEFVHTVREFTTLAFHHAGIELRWEGEGIDEKGIDVKTGKVVVAVSEAFYRPTDVVNLWGDPTKAKKELGWNPQTTTFEQLVQIMVKHDMEKVAADHVAGVMRTNLAEYLEKGIVK